MPRSFALAPRLYALTRRTSLFLSLSAALFGGAAGAHAQFLPPPSHGTQVRDTTTLKPPAGARVAIIEFSDMECPACSAANPILMAAAARYKIPWVRHDFLIPYHVWSTNASINARWFDTKDKALGDEYRNKIFANQRFIYNREMLREFTEQFATEHHIAMPFAIDPQGKLAAEVKADCDLGMQLGINRTPTIFIVTADSRGYHSTEVENPQTDLYRDIDQAFASLASA
jgi:hypothetical protein